MPRFEIQSIPLGFEVENDLSKGDTRPHKEIASNLCVDVLTVLRTVRKFENEGNVLSKKNKSCHKLTEVEEFAILEAVIETPIICLKEVCTKIQGIT